MRRFDLIIIAYYDIIVQDVWPLPHVSSSHVVKAVKCNYSGFKLMATRRCSIGNLQINHNNNKLIIRSVLPIEPISALSSVVTFSNYCTLSDPFTSTSVYCPQTGDCFCSKQFTWESRKMSRAFRYVHLDWLACSPNNHSSFNSGIHCYLFRAAVILVTLHSLKPGVGFVFIFPTH